MKLLSPAFRNQGELALRYTAEGENISPPLEWMEAPVQTKSFFLVMENPENREQGHAFVHWILFDLDPIVMRLPGGLSRDADDFPFRALQGRNSLGRIGYDGPVNWRDSGMHHFVFTLYSLDRTLGLPSGVGRAEIFSAIQDHTLDEAILTVRPPSSAFERSA
jgi:Raf kinase inhibitor-like YbhB/YbcL family protein